MDVKTQEMAQWSKTNVIEITQNRRIDSEFFHPTYINAENFVNNCPNVICLGQIGKFIIGPFGSAFHVNNYDQNSEFRYVRGKDVKPFTLLDDDNVYMPEKDFKRLSRYALEKGDLLISVVGTLGNVAIVPENIKGIFSCKSTVFRNSKINPYYLLAYFNSNYGKQCLLRRQRGAIQMGLNKEDLKTVPVPIIKKENQEAIGKKIYTSLKLNEQSKRLYKEATTLLESELGLIDFKFEHSNKYISKFSEVTINSRQDAEFYQPKYKQLNEKLHNHQVLRVFEISEKLETGVYASEYSCNGLNYIRGVDIDDYGTIEEDQLIKTNSLNPTFNNSVIEDDVLVTRVGSIGVCGINLSDTQMLFSDNLIRIRIKSKFKNLISAKYLNLFLKSKYGQMLMTRYSRGSVQQRLNQTQLGVIPIPILPFDVQLHIQELYMKSLKSKNDSKILLTEAKNEIEKIIENFNI